MYIYVLDGSKRLDDEVSGIKTHVTNRFTSQNKNIARLEELLTSCRNDVQDLSQATKQLFERVQTAASSTGAAGTKMGSILPFDNDDQVKAFFAKDEGYKERYDAFFAWMKNAHPLTDKWPQVILNDIFTPYYLRWHYYGSSKFVV